jgi:hypothetical protein
MDSDLHWSLDKFDRPKQAAEFFARFNGAFSVYSAAVRKIYTEYSTEVVTGRGPLLVIQPDMYEFTSMFHNVEPTAIFRSSVLLYEDKKQMKLSAVREKSGYRETFPFKEGLYKLFNGEFQDGAFLPVITYGDLRTLPGQNRPVLQIHGLKTDQMRNLSEFQIHDIIETMTNNIVNRLASI